VAVAAVVAVVVAAYVVVVVVVAVYVVVFVDGRSRDPIRIAVKANPRQRPLGWSVRGSSPLRPHVTGSASQSHDTLG
jgi:hypothetical protein